ncbi:hypothetical protein [Cryobacterium luteum]|uniref:Uncharacterized protein n=1 Tax=Cryobacterium luteum TaxID=1424661 RepID=A0A1H8ID20_9MICO|nr:hypothetical protein [Cryobacterium luteum]TFB95540.1 hypothetical protein E3O10_00385 [Cryobacterium luteum]SEN66354.1 hypothetical protein SAMN05216281_11152 [Cryobacterium luteum]
MDVPTGLIQGRGRRRFLRIAAIVLAVMLLSGLVSHYLRENIAISTPGWRGLSALAGLVYADGEANLWAWASGLLLAGIALCLATVGFAARNEGDLGAPYFVLAAVAVELSADEIAQLHEKLARFDLDSRFTFAWLTVGVPLAVVACLLLLWIARKIDRLLRRRLIVAGAIYLLGAVGFEAIGGIAVGGRLDELSRASLTYHALVGMEEGLEVTGALIALGAVLSALVVERMETGILLRTRFGRAGEHPLKSAPATQ